MKITREADYALRIIAMLADENRQIEAKAIAEKNDIPYRFTLKILRKIVQFPTVTISNLQGHYKEAEQYLSLIKESDKAFEELVRYLKNYDEPTIVVMFGDHQPAVEQEFYEELYGKSLSKLSTEELQQRYKIPFVIWANYDIESQDDLKTSPNYLSDLLLDTANVPKNEIENFTSEVRNDVPQINAMGHYDSEGNWVSRDEDTSNALDEYEAVEYYMLTRKENKDAKENKDDKK